MSDSALSLAKALTHPVRVQILRRIADGSEVSPSSLSGELGVALATVAYHVRYLTDLGVLSLIRTVPVRGTVQHIYAARDVDAARRLLSFGSELIAPAAPSAAPPGDARRGDV